MSQNTNGSNLNAEIQYSEFMREFLERGLISRKKGWRPLVIKDYILSGSLDEFIEEREISDKRLSKAKIKEVIRESIWKSKPKRWSDTTNSFRKRMSYLGASLNEKNYRIITLWIGNDIIKHAVYNKMELSDLMLKRCRQFVTRACPEMKFGIHFVIERTEYDKYGLHMHGIVYCSDAEAFKFKSKFRKAIVASAGKKFTVMPPRILYLQGFRRTPQNLMNYHYKQHRSFRFSKKKPLLFPADIGLKLHGESHVFNASTKDIYDKTRKVLLAVLRKDVLTWTEDDWLSVAF